MTPEQWYALTPEQQARHNQDVQTQGIPRQASPVYPQQPYYPPPRGPVAKPAANVAAIISLSCGLLGLLLLPILLGPAAIIAGAVGHSVALKSNGPGGRMSIAGILLGAICCVVLFTQLRSL